MRYSRKVMLLWLIILCSIGLSHNIATANESYNTQFTGGDQHSLKVTEDGELYGIGMFTGEVLSQAYSWTEIDIPNVISISAGKKHSLVLDSDHQLWGLGSTQYGQLGKGVSGYGEVEKSPVLIMADVSDMAAGYNHSIAMDNKGFVWAWGQNIWGQLGQKTISLNDDFYNISEPVRIEELVDVNRVYAYGNYNVALNNDGTLWSWGRFEDTRVSDNLLPLVADADLLKYAKVRKIDISSRDIVNLAIGKSGVLAMDTNHQIWYWGEDEIARKLEMEIETRDLVANWSGYYVLDEAGNVYQIDNSDVQMRDLLLRKIFSNSTQIFSGGNHIFVMDKKSTVWGFGRNEVGQLGVDIKYIGSYMDSFQQVHSAIDLHVDGQSMMTKIPPLISDGTTYVQLRGVLEQMGIEVSWDHMRREITLHQGQRLIILNLKSNIVEMDGIVTDMNPSPIILNGSTIIPLRYISEMFGYTVTWDYAERIVGIRG